MRAGDDLERASDRAGETVTPVPRTIAADWVTCLSKKRNGSLWFGLFYGTCVYNGGSRGISTTLSTQTNSSEIFRNMPFPGTSSSCR
jgi:hypothetical protein